MTSADRDALRLQLRRHEGWRTHPYVDTVGKLTIGCGRNLTDRGLSDAEISYLLDNDINDCLNALVTFPWFPTLDPIRQRVFVDLCFMGIGRLRTFTKMLAATAAGEWETAAAELLASKYAAQVGQRARTLATMLRTGREDVNG